MGEVVTHGLQKKKKKKDMYIVRSGLEVDKTA